MAVIRLLLKSVFIAYWCWVFYGLDQMITTVEHTSFFAACAAPPPEPD